MPEDNSLDTDEVERFVWAPWNIVVMDDYEQRGSCSVGLLDHGDGVSSTCGSQSSSARVFEFLTRPFILTPRRVYAYAMDNSGKPHLMVEFTSAYSI